MATATTFDLNQAIQCWRDDLAQAPAFRLEDLDELESHLRDSITKLQHATLSAEEAFTVAVKRIGGHSLLQTEFAKVNNQSVWLDRCLWMLLGVQIWALVFGTANSLSRVLLTFGLQGATFSSQQNILALPVSLFVLVQLGAFAGSLALIWWLFTRKGGKIGKFLGEYWRYRGTLAVTCIVLGGMAIAYPSSAFLQMALIHFSDINVANMVLHSQALAGVIALTLQIIALVTLTLFIARKRLMPEKA